MLSGWCRYPQISCSLQACYVYLVMCPPVACCEKRCSQEVAPRIDDRLVTGRRLRRSEAMRHCIDEALFHAMAFHIH